MNKISVVVLSMILACGVCSSAYALIPNGDFETGDLSDYKVQEDFSDVASSPLVNNVDDGTGNRVGQIETGFTDFGVSTATLARDFSALPADVQDLFFDVRFIDAGKDAEEILELESSPLLSPLDPLAIHDILDVHYETDKGTLVSFFTLQASGYTQVGGTEVESLSNGFYHVRTDISGFAGTSQSTLYFDLFDANDQRLSKVQVDNIGISSIEKSVVPEPATMLLMSGGLLGFGYLRKNKLI